MRARAVSMALLLVGCGETTAIEPCPAPPVPGTAPFVDATDERGLAFEHHTGSDFCDLTDTVAGPGVCALDFDDDGRLDVYVVDRKGHANGLFRNEGGTFRELAAERGADLVDVDAMGCLAFDYDGDGDRDLLVTANGPNQLLRNDGGSFTNVSDASGIAGTPGFSVSASAGDIDRDGDLDLFIGRVVKLETCPDQCKLFPVACEAETNLLYVNEGGVFVERSKERGITEAEPTLATVMVDADRDGDLDIYAGNDMGFLFNDRLYRNDGSGHFVDAAVELGLSAKGTDTMGVDVGDFDRDGISDWVVTDFEHRPIRILHCYDPDLPCSNDVVPDSLTDVKWGVGFVDVDQDAWLDLLVSTGSVASLGPGRTRLFYQRHGDFTESLPMPGEALADGTTGRGLAFGDFDGDGAVDLVVASVGGAVRLLLNRAAGGHSLTVDLDTLAAGALVTARSGSGVQQEHVMIGGSYAGSSDPRIHFGLGEACSADVEVRYLDGTRVESRGVRGQVRIHRD